MISKVIIQAGGKGTRMGDLTASRPKCLVSLGGKPLLYSVSNAFGENIEAIIIGDYKADVLKKYLENFPPPFDYRMILANGTGTSAGLNQAVKLTENEGFAIIWSDLYFREKININGMTQNSIGLSSEISCRWSFKDGKLLEERSDGINKLGVMGVFFFPDPEVIPEIPESGEFVKFLADEGLAFEPMVIQGVREIGTFKAYREERDSQINSRFFNKIIFDGEKVTKIPIDQSFSHLISDEATWYQFVSGKGFDNIPYVFSYDPLKMKFVRGKHPFNLTPSKDDDRKKVIETIIQTLEQLHQLGGVKFNEEEARRIYIEKTWRRINHVAGVIPHAEAEYFRVNGLKVENILNANSRGRLEEVFKLLCSQAPNYTVIHGDPTFSNIILEQKDHKPIFIDPRGYFGNYKIFGDPLYDYSKLYYSAVGNYDFFNQGKFILRMNGTEVKLKIESEKFENTKTVFESYFGNLMPRIEILHSLIWLSLSGYVTDDYNSILASYFNGLKLLEEVSDGNSKVV